MYTGFILFSTPESISIISPENPFRAFSTAHLLITLATITNLITHQNAMSRNPIIFISSFSSLFSLETFCDKKYINGEKYMDNNRRNIDCSKISSGVIKEDLMRTPPRDFISSQIEWLVISYKINKGQCHWKILHNSHDLHCPKNHIPHPQLLFKFYIWELKT